MIELASLGVSAIDEQTGAVVGYAAIFDYPYLTREADQATWPSWLHKHFGQSGSFGPANAAWLSFFVADPLQQTDVIESILRTAFTTLPNIDHLLLALPADVPAARPHAGPARPATRGRSAGLAPLYVARPIA